MTIEISASNNEALKSIFSESAFVTEIISKPNFLVLSVKDGFSAYDVNKFAMDKGFVLTYLNERKRRLEEEFLQITSKN